MNTLRPCGLRRAGGAQPPRQVPRVLGRRRAADERALERDPVVMEHRGPIDQTDHGALEPKQRAVDQEVVLVAREDRVR